MSGIADARRTRLLAAMAEAGAGALLVMGNAWQGDYLCYATGHSALEGDAAAVVLADGETHLFVEGPVEAGRARAAVPEAKVVAADDLIGAVGAFLARLGNRRVLAAPAMLLPWGLAGEGGPEDGTAMLDRLLMTKLPAEIEALRRASEMADRGYRAFVEAARPGRAEFEVVADVEAFFREAGCPDNFMLIGSGGREVRGMHPAGTRRIRAGDLVTTELSPRVDGYYSQICRTLVVGEPTDAQRRAYEVYQDALAAGLAVLRAGVTAAEVARAENEVFRARGLGVYTTSEYTRVRGHGLGLFADSKPHLLEDVETVLEAGAVVVVHPNTYHPDAGYMVLGDAALVTETGNETFSAIPRALIVAGG